MKNRCKIVETIVGEEIASIDTDDNIIEESTTSSSLIPEGSVAVTYKVKNDDSLLGIADLFNTRVSDIKKLE